MTAHDRRDVPGVAEVLDPIRADTTAVSTAVTSVLNNSAFRRVTEQLKNAAAAQPTADTTPAWVANLTAEPDTPPH
jgi:UDP:flavonoid glycosyltransferase YjiC (YdhE family)